MQSVFLDGSGTISGIRDDNTPDWDLYSDASSYCEDKPVIQSLDSDGEALWQGPFTTYQATPESIFDVIQQASAHDIIELSAGEYSFDTFKNIKLIGIEPDVIVNCELFIPGVRSLEDCNVILPAYRSLGGSLGVLKAARSGTKSQRWKIHSTSKI